MGLIAFFFLLLLSSSESKQIPAGASLRYGLVHLALQQVGVLEGSGFSVSRKVKEYMNSVHLCYEPCAKLKFRSKRPCGPPYACKYSWCMAFVSWLFKASGKGLRGGKGFINCKQAVKHFESKGMYRKAGSYTPKPGDVCFFDATKKGANGRLVRGKNGQPDHACLVVAVESASSFWVVSGNDSIGKGRGVVLRKISPKSYYKPTDMHGFGLPDNGPAPHIDANKLRKVGIFLASGGDQGHPDFWGNMLLNLKEQ